MNWFARKILGLSQEGDPEYRDAPIIVLPRYNGLPQVRGELVDEHTPIFHWDDSFSCDSRTGGCGCLWRRLDGNFHSCNARVQVRYINPRLKCARRSCEECGTPFKEREHEIGCCYTPGCCSCTCCKEFKAGQVDKWHHYNLVHRPKVKPKPTGPWRSNMPDSFQAPPGQGRSRS